jgi:hypothetical protein
MKKICLISGLLPFFTILFACNNSYFPDLQPNISDTIDNSRPRPFYEDDNNDTIIIDTTVNSIEYIGKLKTWTSNDWDFWELTLLDSTYGQIKTWTSNDWDYWEFDIQNYQGKIRTWTSEDWDYWEVTSGDTNYSIRTCFSEDWDCWEINSNDISLNARTWTSNDFDYWEIYNDSVYYKIRTWTSNDWDYWEIFADTNFVRQIDLPAVCFIPIFASSIYSQGILEQKKK